MNNPFKLLKKETNNLYNKLKSNFKLHSTPKQLFISTILIILIIIITILIVIKLIKYYKSRTVVYENFEQPEYDLLISNWDTGSGFYSQLLFKLNHYLYCKKYNINYKTNSDNWQYKFKTGWTDYFNDVTLNSKQMEAPRMHTLNGCCTILEQFPLSDYVSTVKEYYNYNTQTESHIKQVKANLNLKDGEYGAIYIRRGDKLVDEIKFIPSNKFVELLLEKYPNCTTIFVQTDDYNSYLEVKDYIDKNYNGGNDGNDGNDGNGGNGGKIKVLTLCPPTNFGSIAHSGYIDKMKNDKISTLKEGTETLSENKEYIKKINNNLAKPISDMTPEERYEHTMELLTGVDICTKSKICVCDYNSNVSRFIKIAHNHFDSVYDINKTDSQISLNTLKCPGFDFDSIHNK
jgi:hypothetical protein